MRFSVVIPLYNKAPYIINAVKSVLAQTFTDFELIVVDDGSSDGGADLVEALDDRRLRVVRQANVGVSATRNNAINLACGEWVAFLDADDWHHPDYLATLVTVQNRFPEADTVASKFVALPHSEGIWPPAWPDIKNEQDIELISDLPTRWTIGPTLFTSSVAVRTSQLKKMQPCFPLGESRGEDLDLWFRLAEHSPIALARAPLVAYRLGIKGSLTSAQDELVMEPFILRMKSRALSGMLTSKQRRSALRLVAHFQVSMARQAIASGSRIEGLRWLLEGYYGIQNKRWWLTALMALAVPSQLVKNWELWRINRTLND